MILNETIFYPQGGGQPYDQGTIQNESGKFMVEEVRFVEGVVKHIGTGHKFQIGEQVSLNVDESRRKLHMRLHSGGHVLDMAVNKLGLGWKPGKGYHYPDGPYIEYEGNFEESEKENLREKIEAAANEFTAEGIATTIKFLPDQLVNGKPARVVLYGTFSVPCGGTHVANLKDIGSITIRKISNKKGLVRVAYQVS
jgi:Ser-tRNA(Ala) deacylase AlaX